MTQPALRVGLLLDTPIVPAWIRQVIEDIVVSAHADLILVVLNAEPRSRMSVAKLRRISSHLTYRAYSRLDHAIFRGRPDAFTTVSLDDLLSTARMLSVVPERKGFVHRFDARAIETIRDTRLDVLIRFGFNILKGDVLRAATHGVWSYHHGDNRLYRGGPPFFWEMFEGQPITGTLLQILNEDLDGGYVIYRSSSATDFTSLTRGKNAAYWKSAHFVGRCLRDLHRDPDGFQSSRTSLQASTHHAKRLYRTPTNRTMSIFFAKLLRHLVSRGVQRLTHRDEWSVAVRQRSGDESSWTPGGAFQLLRAPRGHFFADPFVIDADNRSYVFFEDFSRRSGRGSIAYAELGKEIRSVEIRTALTAEHHLSYPCLFEDGTDIYMVPETYEAVEVQVFKATAFPTSWSIVSRVPGLRAVDPTIVRWNGRYWLFCNVASPGMSPNDELHVFHATRPEGPWKPHRGNPIVSDVSCARPAGSIFEQKGVLLRPAQDSSRAYGKRVRFFRIDRLDEGHYEEQEVGELQVEAPNNVTGIHTHNRSATLEVIDVRLRWHRLHRVTGKSFKEFRILVDATVEEMK